MNKKFNKVLLAATGSVAALKIPILVASLREHDFEVSSFSGSNLQTGKASRNFCLVGPWSNQRGFIQKHFFLPGTSSIDRKRQALLQPCWLANGRASPRRFPGMVNLAGPRRPSAAYRAGQVGRPYAHSSFGCQYTGQNGSCMLISSSVW